jgi:hypothetical protein
MHIPELLYEEGELKPLPSTTSGIQYFVSSFAEVTETTSGSEIPSPSSIN